MPNPSNKAAFPDLDGLRVHSLRHVGMALWWENKCLRPMDPKKVWRIEQRALAKVKKALEAML